MLRGMIRFSLVVLCSAIFMVSACEIGESPIELARKPAEPEQKAPAQTMEPAPTEQQTVPDEALPPETSQPVEIEPLRPESLEQVKAWAAIDEDKGTLRAGADANADVVQELPFATLLFVLERDGSWYKVSLTDKKTWGWIPSQEVHVSDLSPDQFRLDDLANFYYAISTGLEDKAKKARFLNLLIEQYPQSMIYFREPGTKMAVQGAAKELALFALADIYKSGGEYQHAIEAYGTIIGEAKKTDVRGYAEWNLLKIYKNNLKDSQKTIEQALHIIDAYEKLGISGFEWNIWVDIEAAEVLLDTLTLTGTSGSDLVRYGKEVLTKNTFPPVQVIGSIIIADGYRKQNDLPAMESTIFEALRKHPTSEVQYFKESVDYSTKALSFVAKFYIEKRHDYESALAFSQKAAASTSNRTMANNAKFIIAYISDIWLFDRGEVISAYEDCGNVKNFLYGGGSTFSDTRLQAIQGFVPFSGAVSPEVVSVLLEPNGSSPSVFSLTKGEKVLVLYRNPRNFQGAWLKVKTRDNRFGWVQEGVVEKEK